MLEIGMNGIIKNFGFRNILSGASLEIMTGERVAIVGRNGAGKSTLLKLIAGEENPDAGIVTVRRGATVCYLEQIPKLPGADVATRDILMQPFEAILASERRLRTLEASLASEQDADALDKLMRQYAFQQSQYEALGGYEVEERFGRITQGFGLTELLDRPFAVLSGGQKTIVMLACTMLRQPDILLLDEPTNHLDMRTLEWFEAYLSKYRGTVVIVSHDRYFLDRTTEKTILLDNGMCTTFAGNYTFARQEEERLLLLEFEQYKNQQKQIEAMKAAIARYYEWGRRSDDKRHFRKAHELEKRLEKMEILARPQLEKPKISLQFSGKRTGREVLRLKDYSLSIGELRLLEDVTVTLFYQQKVCLLGDNGAGKTTFVRALLGEARENTETLFLAPSAKLGYIPQEIRFRADTLSVLEAFREEHPSSEGEARGILAKFFFYGDAVRKRVGALSGGEKVLLKLAILVQRQVNFLILDEPTNHIDMETREMLEEALLDYGGTLLFISHDRYFIQRIADRIWAIENRRLYDYDGGYDAYRKAHNA